MKKRLQKKEKVGAGMMRTLAPSTVIADLTTYDGVHAFAIRFLCSLTDLLFQRFV